MKTQGVYTLEEVAEIVRIVPQRPRIAIVGTIACLLLLVAGAVIWAAVTNVDLVVRAPARVRAKSVPKVSFTATSGEQIAATIAGRIDKLLVAEGQTVKQGDALAVLDSVQLQNDRARLDAAVTGARDARDAADRMLALAQGQFDAAQAERQAEVEQAIREESQTWKRSSADVALAHSALDAVRHERDRIAALVGDGAASQVQLDQVSERIHEAEARVSSAQVRGSTGRVEVLRRQIVLAERDFAVHKEELAQRASARVAEVAAAERNLANLDVELAKATLRAGHTGVVGSIGVRPGDVVQPNQVVFAITPSDGVRIDAAIPAAEIGLVRVGMRVRVRLDAFDWQRYGTLGGTITQIGTDAESVSTSGGPASIYVVRIEVDGEVVGRGDLHGLLKLGMTGTVEVVIETRKLLPILLGHLNQALSLG